MADEKNPYATRITVDLKSESRLAKLDALCELDERSRPYVIQRLIDEEYAALKVEGAFDG